MYKKNFFFNLSDRFYEKSPLILTKE
jgi:hypothetical protein